MGVKKPGQRGHQQAAWATRRSTERPQRAANGTLGNAGPELVVVDEVGAFEGELLANDALATLGGAKQALESGLRIKYQACPRYQATAQGPAERTPCWPHFRRRGPATGALWAYHAALAGRGGLG